MKRRIAWALGGVLLSLAGAPGARAAAARWGLLSGQDVHVRSGPGLTYRAMCKLDRDTIVEVQDVSADGRWLRIAAPAKGDVYIFAKYLRIDGARGVLTGDNVRVRVRPDLTGELVNKLNKGAVVKVKGRVDDWVKVAPPPDSVAWVSTQYVKRMTDSELALYKKQQADATRRELERRKREQERLARLQREAERKRQEAERVRREAERLRQETQFVARLDEQLAAELRKPPARRALSRPLAAYRTAGQQVKDTDLRAKIQAKVTLLTAMERIRAAAAAERDPPPLPKLDDPAMRTRWGMTPDLEALRAAHTHAAERAKRARARTARKADKPPPLEGWISYLGAGLRETGATHRLVRNRRVLVLLRSGRIDLDAFIGMPLRITGQVAGHARLAPGQEPLEVVDVSRAERVFVLE